MLTARISFNAFDKDSSASYSQTHEGTPDEIKAASILFDKDVPFPRFYRDDEILECSPENEAAFEAVIEN